MPQNLGQLIQDFLAEASEIRRIEHTNFRVAVGGLTIEGIDDPELCETIRTTFTSEDFKQILLEKKVSELQGKYEAALKGTPEGEYLSSLIMHYHGEKVVPRNYDPEILDTSIEDLAWSARTLNCLKRGGIIYFGQLVTLTEDDVYKLKNMGEKSVDEIKAQLARYNLSLGMDVKYEKPMVVPED